MLSPEEREAIAEDAASVKSTEEIRAEEEAAAALTAKEVGAGAAIRDQQYKPDAAAKLVAGEMLNALARVKTHLTLRRLQQHLETLVDERTAELRAALAR